MLYVQRGSGRDGVYAGKCQCGQASLDGGIQLADGGLNCARSNHSMCHMLPQVMIRGEAGNGPLP